MIFIIIQSININNIIIWGINTIICITIELIIFRIQIIICLILILSTIIKIIIFIREIIIFRNPKSNSPMSWQRTQENWILTQDPLALDKGQASSSAMSGLTQRIDRAAQVSGLTTWCVDLVMRPGQGSCSATWRVCLTQHKGKQPKCQVSPCGGMGLANAEGSPTKTWIDHFPTNHSSNVKCISVKRQPHPSLAAFELFMERVGLLLHCFNP